MSETVEIDISRQKENLDVNHNEKEMNIYELLNF